MQSTDKKEFISLMVALAEYYSREVSENILGMYWQGLEQYEIAAIREALNRHMRNPDSGQFMPKIADIARMLGGSTQDSALVAWAKVDQAVRRVGTYADVVFDDPLIHRVLHDMGGWIAMGQKNEDEWPFVAKEFENRYRGFKARSEAPEYPHVLTGIASAHNSRAGYKTEPPMLIGNALKAQKVMTGGTDKPLIGLTRLSDTAGTLRLVNDEGENAA